MPGAVRLRRAARRGEDVDPLIAERFGIDLAVLRQPDPRKPGILEGVPADGRAAVGVDDLLPDQVICGD